MSLLENAMVDCVFLDKRHEDDGQGGYTTVWTEGAAFRAAVTFNTSMEARAAEVSGVTSMYTITTEQSVVLEYHDVFRRLSDGKVFRVTSDGDDKRSPASASFRIAQVTAEEWRLTS